MGLQEMGAWLRCSTWARWLFILSGAGGGFLVGGKLNYRGGKRFVAALIGGGAGWLTSWLLGRTCGGNGGGGDMLPEWGPEGDDYSHLLGPAQAQYDPLAYTPVDKGVPVPAMRNVTPTGPSAMFAAKAPKTTTPIPPMQPVLTTTNKALLSRTTQASGPAAMAPLPTMSSGPTPSAPSSSGYGFSGTRRPRKNSTLLGGTRGKAYGS